MLMLCAYANADMLMLCAYANADMFGDSAIASSKEVCEFEYTAEICSHFHNNFEQCRSRECSKSALVYVAGEDDEWGSDAEGPASQAEPALSGGEASPQPQTGKASTSPRSPECGAPDERAAPPSPPPPRLRLNTRLATDPALRTTPPPPPPLEYLSALPTAFHPALATFCLPPLPEVPPAPVTTPRPKLAESLESRQAPVYMCTPCGIRFSSLSTLEAHQTYYCSHRTKQKGRDSDSDDGKTPSLPAVGSEPAMLSRADDSSASESISEVNGLGPACKAARTGKQYACPHCSYSADKKVSLNRHMRMHCTSPATPAVHVPSVNNGSAEARSPDVAHNSPHLVDRYCQDCDIRFSSVKTFRAHKLHYCSTRHVVKNSNATTPPTLSTPKSSSVIENGPVSPSENASRTSLGSPNTQDSGHRATQPFLALPTNPILIVPYSLFQGASLLTGSATLGLPSNDTACILLPNGTLQPVAQGLLSHTVPPPLVSSVSAVKEERRIASTHLQPGDMSSEQDACVDGKKHQKARAKICLMVKSNCFIHVRVSTTVKEAWESLRKAYEDKGLLRRLGLLRALFIIKLSDFKNMEDYISANLLSVSTMVSRGIVVVFSDCGCKMYHKDDFEAFIYIPKQKQSKWDSKSSESLCDPKAVVEALSRKDRKMWESAMHEEHDSLLENETWELVDLPKNVYVVQCKWAFKIKRGANTDRWRYKARLVARGFTQEFGVDYHETFVSEGFIAEDQEHKVCRLKIAIYGLKRASWVWNQQIHKIMLEVEFTSKNEEDKMKLVQELGTRFKLKDLGEVQECLGMRVVRNTEARTISLNQRKHWTKTKRVLRWVVLKSAGNQGKKRTAALSSVEAEYLAMSEVTKEAIHSKASALPSHSPRIPDMMLPLDLRMHRSPEAGNLVVDLDTEEERDEEEKTPCRLSPERENIVCAPSIPLILSTSSACSTPSPPTVSPALSSSSLSNTKSRHPSGSPSPRNGVIYTNSTHKKAINAAISQLAVVQDPPGNLSQLLLAAVAAAGQSEDGNGAIQLKSPHSLIHTASKHGSKPTPQKPLIQIPPLIPPSLMLAAPRPSSDLLASPGMLPLITPEMAFRIASEQQAPQVLVKQGVSKCRECNIVFCKHENYLAHKKHYCSARTDGSTPEEGVQKPQSPAAVASSPGGSNSASSPTHSGGKASPTPGQKPPLFQFICVACGIKFTSFDNLTAHQAYYCPKRGELAVKSGDAPAEKTGRKCSKCKVSSCGDKEFFYPEYFNRGDELRSEALAEVWDAENLVLDKQLLVWELVGLTRMLCDPLRVLRWASLLWLVEEISGYRNFHWMMRVSVAPSLLYLSSGSRELGNGSYPTTTVPRLQVPCAVLRVAPYAGRGQADTRFPSLAKTVVDEGSQASHCPKIHTGMWPCSSLPNLGDDRLSR
ncbi:hypothetical protein PR048_021259 [Dryococelus australis]|uniref:Uncharacterized protein n=1 Tax=Dryococelus australis TaxID=614101 RepID=A0ABQ9GXP4_9NEOP|nr:hypothetical protein PR048_021259 [Dryococelus australis]